MSTIVTALGQINYLNMLWIFFFVFILHELEEWNIDQFEHQHFKGLPPAATDRSARMWIGFVILVGLVWCALATLPGDPRLSAWIFLPAIAIMLQNAIQHIFWSLYFKRYAPGTITSILLVIPFGSYLIARAVQEGYVPVVYTAVCAAFILAGTLQTVRAGSNMTALIRTINNIGIWLSDRLLKPERIHLEDTQDKPSSSVVPGENTI